MSMTDAWPRFTCAQYDGTPATATDVMDVANLVGYETWDLMSSTPAQIVIKERRQGSVLTVPSGGWVMRNGMDAIRQYSEVEFPLTFSRRRAVVQEAADVSYFGSGVGTSAVSIGIGVSGAVNVRVDPPIPASAITDASFRLKSIIMSSTGAAVGTVTITGTPTITTALVPEATSNGVLVPAHTVIRTAIRNTGVGILTSVQIYTTAHV